MPFVLQRPAFCQAAFLLALSTCSGGVSGALAQSRVAAPVSNAGEGRLPEEPGAVRRGAAEAKEADRLAFDKLLTMFEDNAAGRFGRAFEYDFQRVEQPQVLTTGTGAIVPNPERYLNEHTLKFQFSEVFPSSANLAAAFKATCDLLGSKEYGDKTGIGECSNPRRFDWIASGGGWWARTLSGISMSVDLSERAALQQGVIVTDSSFRTHYQTTGSFEFEPSQMFLSGTNWNKAAGALGVSTRCEGRDDCRRLIQGTARPRLKSGSTGLRPDAPTRRTLALAAFVPSFSYRRVSQFDFIKAGGILVPTTYLKGAQNQFSFKWDLKRSIPSAASRSDAAGLIAPPKPAGERGSKLCMIESQQNVRSYINVPENFQAGSCAAFAKGSRAEKYALGCVTDDGIDVGEVQNAGDEPRPKEHSCWEPDRRRDEPDHIRE